MTRPPLARRIAAWRGPVQAFRDPGPRPWLWAGLVLLALLVLAPLHWRSLVEPAQRIGTFAAMVFLLAALGQWFRMGHRAYPAALAIVILVALVSTGTALAFGLDDLFLLALVVSFALFILAGVYVVLVIEEMVHDAHRGLHLAGRSPAWAFAPLVLLAGLTVALPAWTLWGGPRLGATWGVAVAGTLLISVWWIALLAFAGRDPRTDRGLREIHMLAIAALTATVLADLLKPVVDGAGLLPSLLAYLILLGTWVYVSYTTLQRTHHLLPGRDPLPWLSLMLCASFAILVHSRKLYLIEGGLAVEQLVGRRFSYFVAGLWIGIAFHVVRTLGEALWDLTQRSRRPVPAAAQAHRLTERLLDTEARFQDAAVAVFREVDRMIPGPRRPPSRRRRRTRRG